MPMNGVTLETELLTQIDTVIVSEASWAAQITKDVKDQLQLEIGEPAWSDGDLDNTLTIITNALGNAIAPHLQSIVNAVALKVVEHIQTNALVSTTTTGVTAQACSAGGAAGTSSGTGTGTVA